MLSWLIDRLGAMSATAWVAVYGALLATVNAIWSWRRAASDRGRLRVTATIGRIHEYNGRDIVKKGEEDLISLTITNVGTKPVHLAMIGGSYESKAKGLPKFFDVFIANRPRYKEKLEPGEKMTVPVHQARLLQEENVLWLGAEDTLGNRYGLRGRQIKKLAKEAKRPIDPAKLVRSSALTRE